MKWLAPGQGGGAEDERQRALVCLGCYNKTPHAEFLVNNRNLFLVVLGVCFSN